MEVTSSSLVSSNLTPYLRTTCVSRFLGKIFGKFIGKSGTSNGTPGTRIFGVLPRLRLLAFKCCELFLKIPISILDCPSSRIPGIMSAWHRDALDGLKLAFYGPPHNHQFVLLCGRLLRLNPLQTTRTQADDPAKHLWLSVFGVRIEAGKCC